MLAKANLTAPVRRENFVPALAFRAHFPQRVDPSPSVDFVMPIVPPVSLATLPSNLFNLSRHGGVSDGAPLSVDALNAAYRVHSPLTYSLRVPRERVLIVAGRGDRIVPPEHPYALWRHWGEPAIHWYSGSHCAPFRRSSIFAAGMRHLEQLGILRPS